MPSVSRDALHKLITTAKLSTQQRELALLRLEYSEIAKIKGDYLQSLRTVERIYPTILPIQASGRSSYLNPALNNFPKKCINPECPRGEHEKTHDCWSLCDCLIPDENTFWIEHDLDAVEHRIYCLILHWNERIADLKSGVDIHTPVACMIFNLPSPSNLINPHMSLEDSEWRSFVKWRGKDDGRRTLGKNFTFGGQYAYVEIVPEGTKVKSPTRVYQGLKYSPKFVENIPNIQSYLIEDSEGNLVSPDLEALAIRFVESNIEIQKRKAILMAKHKKDGYARTLYGGKRVAWTKDQESAKFLFNHTIQGTVASYIKESAIMLQKAFPTSYMVQDKHDALKWAHYYESSTEEGKVLEREQILDEHKRICQRPLSVDNNTLTITATFKTIY